MRYVALCVALLIAYGTARGQVLYEVSGNGLKDKSYILGSNHLLASGSLAGVPGVFRAFNHCERVVGEIEIDEQAAMVAMVRYGKAEKTLDELLDFDEQMLVDSMLRKETGVGLQAVMMFKPGIIASLWMAAVCQSMYPRGADDEPMDSYFQKMALIEGKEVRGLETMEEQMKLLIRGTEEAQARELVELMRTGKDKLKVDIEALTKMYADGDLEGVAAVEEREYTEAARLELLEGRNERWMKKLVEMMKEKRCLVVIGAMNLTGNSGLIRAFRAKGYIVKAVNE